MPPSVIRAPLATTVYCKVRVRSVPGATTAQQGQAWTGRLVPAELTVTWLGSTRRVSVSPAPPVSTVMESTSVPPQVRLADCH